MELTQAELLKYSARGEAAVSDTDRFKFEPSSLVSTPSSIRPRLRSIYPSLAVSLAYAQD